MDSLLVPKGTTGGNSLFQNPYHLTLTVKSKKCHEEKLNYLAGRVLD